jgi:ABC-type hemin transport system ATPase subunit
MGNVFALLGVNGAGKSDNDKNAVLSFKADFRQGFSSAGAL